MEEVHNQVALLVAKVADLKSSQAVLNRAPAEFHWEKRLLPTGAMSREDYERRQEAVSVADSQVKVALEHVYNATGNFVKVVQRLPVRIEIMDYDPESAPLFVGLSVVPYVFYKELPTGPSAGKILQPYAAPAPSAGTTNSSCCEANP